MENINLIIPMAGGGTRFKKEGIEMPKPLINLNGKPFLVNTINCKIFESGKINIYCIERAC